MILTLVAYFCTVFSDPGILPRKLYDPSRPTNCIFIIIKVSGDREAIWAIKICSTCHILRPLRSFHCSICDCCIDEHGNNEFIVDHHCA